MATILTDQVPAAPNDSDSTRYTLGVEWSCDIDASWTGVRVYTPTTQPSADYQVVGYEVTSQTTGTEIARGTAPFAGAGQWQEIAFATPVRITAGTHYVASYITPDFFTATVDGWNTTIVNGHLTGYGDRDSGAFNGRIHIGDDFPELESGNKANYFADPLVSFGITVALPTAIETNVAMPMSGLKSRALATAAEMDTALTLGRVKKRSLPMATETDTALAFAGVKRRPLGTATELDSALAITASKRRLLPMAVEFDQALPFTAPDVAVGRDLPIVSSTPRDIYISRTSGGVL